MGEIPCSLRPGYGGLARLTSCQGHCTTKIAITQGSSPPGALSPWAEAVEEPGSKGDKGAFAPGSCVPQQPCSERGRFWAGGDVFVDGEVGEEGCAFGCPHLVRAALAVGRDKAPDLVHAGIFGVGGIAFKAAGLAHLSDGFLRFCCHRGACDC